MNIVVYFDDPGIYDYPFNKDDYLRAYDELSRKIVKKGQNFYIVRSFDTYKGKGLFSRSWIFDDSGELIESGHIKADLVFDKGAENTFIASDVKTINSKELNDICVDKLLTYDLFPEMSPASKLAKNIDEARSISKEIESEKYVVKPVEGFGGRGVQILDKNDSLVIKQRFFPVIVQSYIDTTAGIKGITKGVHDLRIVIVSGKMIVSYVREPEEGKYVANFAQGGVISYVDIDKLPKEALDLVNYVDENLTKFTDRIYAIDMAFEGDKPFLIELNSRPGIGPTSRGPEAVQLQEAVVDLLTKSI